MQTWNTDTYLNYGTIKGVPARCLLLIPRAMSQHSDVAFSSDAENTPLVETIEALSQERHSSDDENDENAPEVGDGGRGGQVDDDDDEPEGRADGGRAPFAPSQHSDVDGDDSTLQDYWSTIPEVMSKLLMTWNVSNSGSLTPNGEDVLKMCGVSKAFKLIPEDSPSLMSSPYDGPSYMFVAPSLGEIPDYAQKVIWFFSNLRNSITDYANYCVPTNKVAVQANRGDPRVISRLVAVSESHGGYGRAAANGASFINMGNFAKDRRNHHSGTIRTPIKALKIQVGSPFVPCSRWAIPYADRLPCPRWAGQGRGATTGASSGGRPSAA